MLVRLAFSVMIHVDAEILLIDEVLAVGDAAFQQKCYDEFERIHSSGATVLFVTHDMSAVKRFCNRALLLERGRPVELGDPEHVGNRYLELNFSEQARAVEKVAAAAEEAATSPLVAPTEPGVDTAAARGSEAASEPRTSRDGDGRAEILGAWFEDERGEPSETLHNGRPCAFAARVRFNEDVENPLFGVDVTNSHRDHLVSACNMPSEARSGVFRAGEVITFRIRFENLLAPDRYHATPTVASHAGAWIERRERMIAVVVTGTRDSDALLKLPYDLSIERGASQAVAPELIR
jgi:ABC-2 type transport system ATP-binding protein